MARPFRIALLASAAALLIPNPAMAQATSDPAVAPAPVAATTDAAKRIFTPADFARYAPKNALDMLRQVPGFSIREADQERGLGQASENVLINGQRISSKSGGAVGELQKIAATSVERIEIVEAATLGIAGLTGQVANIIVKAAAASGQFAYEPEFRPHFTDPLLTRGSISYSGTRGIVNYTLGLESGGNRSGAGLGGGTQISDGNDVDYEFRRDKWRANSNNLKASGRFGIDLPGSAVANINLSGGPNWYDYREISRRDRPDGIDRVRKAHQTQDGWAYEIGGDVAFALGPGRLKLIGLAKADREPFDSIAIFDFADGSPSIGDRVTRDGRSRETIGRAEYGWKMGGADWQLSGEAAFNTLDSTTRLYELNPASDFVEIDFPEGTGKVREDRFEGLLTYSRPLAHNLDLQLVGGAEFSRLTSQSVIGEQARSFLRPKGSASLAWKANKDFDLSLKLRRRVGQLNFYDFLASVNLTDDRENAGNINLVPQQSWEIDVEGIRKLGAWGTTRLRLFGRRIDDIVDVIPIGEDGESPGNIPRAVRYGFEWKTTLLFDPIGWKGAKLDATVAMVRSRLDDPLTGQPRSLSGDLQRLVELNLRHDIPGSNWAWGGSFSYAHNARYTRLTERFRVWEGPIFAGLFVEHKDVYGLTVRADAGNLLNARSRFERAVYDGRRTDPILFKESRDRLIGPIFSLSVKGKF